MLNLKELLKNLNENKETMTKREVIKTILTVNLLRKNKNKRFWTNIYNNHEINNQTVDLYFENIKEGKVILYKFLKSATKEEIKQIETELSKQFIPFATSIKGVVINLKDYSKDIDEIEEKIREII